MGRGLQILGRESSGRSPIRVERLDSHHVPGGVLVVLSMKCGALGRQPDQDAAADHAHNLDPSRGTDLLTRSARSPSESKPHACLGWRTGHPQHLTRAALAIGAGSSIMRRQADP